MKSKTEAIRKLFRKLLLTGAAVVMMMSLNAVAHADTVTFVFNSSNTISSGASTPLTGDLIVTITDVADTNAAAGGTGTQNVMFTITNNTNGDLRTLRLNYAGGLGGVSGAILPGMGPQPTLQNISDNGVTDASLQFDLGFTFPGGNPDNRLGPNGSITSTFTLDANVPLFATSFTLPALAHLISLDCANQNGDTDCGSIKVGPTTPTPVPEPATMFLLGTGLAGVAAKARRRRQAADTQE